MSPCPDRASWAGETGFSLLEVIIALTILLTVLVSVSQLLQTSFKVGANSRYEQEATSIASATLDHQLATGVTTLLGEEGDTKLTSVTSSGQIYLLEMEVAPYDPGNLQCQSPASDPGAMLKVTIWATWTDQTSGATWWLSGSSAYTHLLVEETSLVAVPASAINPTLGSILVSIEGATGNGIPNVPVTATPSSGSPQTVTTSAGGCALFANIAASPTTWTLTFAPLSGYLTEQNLTTLPTQSNLSLAASTTTTVTFSPGASAASATAFDKAATVNPVYAVPMADGVHPILPSNISSMPLSLYSSNLVTSPYVSASPASAFPMPGSPSYYVVAGSCGAESAPDGGNTDGQPVTLTAGGTGSPTINLVPVQIFVQQGSSLVSGASLQAATSNSTGTGADNNCPTSGTTVMPTLNLGNTCTTCFSSIVRGIHHPKTFILVSNCTSNCNTSTTMTQPTTATYGSPVTLTATVTCTSTGCNPVNSGTITFKAGAATLGAATVNSSGVATINYSGFSLGTTGVNATYQINGQNSGEWKHSAPSAPLNELITASPTTTTVTSTPNPNAYGTSTILTATVTANSPSTATPTGTVTFKNNGVNITTPSSCVNVALSSGTANCTLSGLAGGNYSVTAVYAPAPANFTGSTSATLTQSVTAASTTTALTSSSSPNSTSGQSVTFTATVTAASGGTPTGTVAFKDGATTLGSVALNGFGIAQYSTSALAIGSHTITAVFTATTPANFGTSTGTLVQGVNAAWTLVGLPYGVWHLIATYSNGPNNYFSSNAPTQIVLTVTPAGFSVNGGAVQAAGSAVTVTVQ
jgi:Tfp pilus assembly protein PilV